MKTLLMSLLLVGCVVETGDEELETTESEIQYCPDEECDPYTPVARPDLTADGDTSCNIMATPTGYKLRFEIRNIGTDRASSTTARVSFREPRTGEVGTPVYYTVTALERGSWFNFPFTVDRNCVSDWGGCDITVTADYYNAQVEKSETNNSFTWHCDRI